MKPSVFLSSQVKQHMINCFQKWIVKATFQKFTYLVYLPVIGLPNRVEVKALLPHEKVSSVDDNT